MNGITLMVDEHKLIKRMLKVMRQACIELTKGAAIDYDDFAEMIDFVRSFADQHHHGKEEKFLFTRMVDEIGGAAEKLVKFGMLVEHDLGRLFMNDLEEALQRVKDGDEDSRVDVIANAVSYTHLLHRHIGREDDIAYPFAEKQLSQATLDEIHNQCFEFEKEMAEKGIQDKYLEILERMEKKYL